ncbi:MAG TPA: 2,3-bisphosphoglycerate-independent phosphoglycerate mutase [Candidatus Paceibacterota bacterium]|nr:2,3-bisphosphoglycerate-independent phosphoglycerate mutase [Candidatus Paceibacterota bacterium]
MKKQVALIILDGWGHRTDSTDNAIAKSDTEYFDYLWDKYPHSFLQAGEEHVGLPKGQVGNSEIGHMTIGAGQIIDTDLVRISKTISSGEFEQNPCLNKTFEHAENNNSMIHIMGLLGNGGVHSHQEHLLALIDFLQNKNKKLITKNKKPIKAALHLFTDGRDCNPQDSISALEQLAPRLNNDIFISTISGRYFAMDRDNNWDRLEKFMQLISRENFATNASQNPAQQNDAAQYAENPATNASQTNINFAISEIKKQHHAGKSDEHIEPFAVANAPLQKNDGIIIFNFRADRVRMLTAKLLEQNIAQKQNWQITTFTEYNSDFAVDVAFPARQIETVLANEISLAGLTQAHIAETEKFPHATYFLNGGREEPHIGEEHVLIASRKDVATHDLAPEMRAREIADVAIEKIKSGVDFVFINFANPDMVGHTANLPAIITAIETVDRELRRVIEALLKNHGVAIVTADHGNAELNIDPKTKEKHTSHTLSPVPCILVGEKLENSLLNDGSLKDLTPTILQLFEIKKPVSMTGESLIYNK